MKWVTTSIYEKNAQAYLKGRRHIFNEGGTYSSKTYSILQLLILIATYAPQPLLISIIAESVPHIKRGCLRDFINLMGADFDPSKFNKTDSVYDFGNGKIEFFSADEPSKLRGARRDILFINEVNNIPYDAYRELDTRTKKCTIADWNPVSEFFIHEHGLINDPDTEYIHSTYKDAVNVTPPEVIKNIEAMGARDPNWANVYLYGKLGKIEGLVYPYFEQVNELPAGDCFYGLDFGYSNDPSVLTKNVIIEDRLYSQELIYQTGLTNDMISNRMTELGVRQHYDEIYADAAEPKSIEEIHKSGFNIKACPKGADSVEFGHQKIRQFTQYWPKDSTNCIKEQRNFRYIPDKDGKLTDKTTHNFSHGMDSRRYAVIGKTGGMPPGKMLEQDITKTNFAFKGVRSKEF